MPVMENILDKVLFHLNSPLHISLNCPAASTSSPTLLVVVVLLSTPNSSRTGLTTYCVGQVLI